MKPTSSSWLLFAAIVFCGATIFLSGQFSLAQESNSERRAANDDRAQRSELGARQRLVETKMQELEEKLIVIAERLQEKEPKRAQRLIDAYQQAKEKLITQEMAEVSKLLDEDKLSEAEDRLNAVIENLADLIRLLMNEKTEVATKQQEIQNLQKWQKAIQTLQNEQQKQTRETNKVANKDETLNRLDNQIKKLEGLIKDQQDVANQTESSAGAGLHELDRLADKQYEIRKETDNLAKEIATDASAEIGKAGDSKNKNDPKSGDPKSGDPKSGESKSGDPKSGDPKSGDPKSGESKSGESKSGESKSGESKSGESKSGESKSGESKSGESKSGSQSQPPQPGQKPLEQASKNQRRAEEKLGSAKTKDAERQQQMAIAEMEKAKTELKKERRRIASLPPEAFEQMAEKQRRTRDKALDIARQMEKAPKGKPQDGDNQNASQQNQQQPGQKQMQKASDSMKGASEDLENQQAQNAENRQKQAQKEMQKALDEIEERLNQLREETRAEKLARLEGRFREMLERQQLVSIETIELDDKSQNLGRLRRRDQLVLLRLSTEELEISELGQQAYDLLLEDGTSDVFPEVVQAIREDLNRVASLLEDERTDQLTQLLQKDIEGALEELLEALKDAKKSGGGGGGGQSGGKQPLLKKSHEYKILKLRQRRINRRTKQLDRIRNEQDQAQVPADPQLDDEIIKTADEQAKLLELTEDIMDDN